MQHFASYIRLIDNFVIQTDHINLKYIFKGKKVNKDAKQESSRLIRWALYLSTFPGQIEFVQGNSKPIKMVDFLSRHNYEDDETELGQTARELDPMESTLLENDCADCSVDVYEKVSENTDRSAAPDLEKLPKIRQILRKAKATRNRQALMPSLQHTIGTILPSQSSDILPIIWEESEGNHSFSTQASAMVDDVPQGNSIVSHFPPDPVHYDDDNIISPLEGNREVLCFNQEHRQHDEYEELPLISDDYFIKEQQEGTVSRKKTPIGYYEEENLPDNLLQYLTEQDIHINSDNIDEENHRVNHLYMSTQEASRYVPLAS